MANLWVKQAGSSKSLQNSSIQAVQLLLFLQSLPILWSSVVIRVSAKITGYFQEARSQQCTLPRLSGRAPRIFFILSAWLCIKNGTSKMTLPICSNFSHLFLTILNCRHQGNQYIAYTALYTEYTYGIKNHVQNLMAIF